jgi:hypothetical protein
MDESKMISNSHHPDFWTTIFSRSPEFQQKKVSETVHPTSS